MVLLCRVIFQCLEYTFQVNVRYFVLLSDRTQIWGACAEVVVHFLTLQTLWIYSAAAVRRPCCCRSVATCCAAATTHLRMLTVRTTPDQVSTCGCRQ